MTPKSFIMGAWWVCLSYTTSAQSPNPASQVIEGGKIFVELVKAFAGKKEAEKDTGCKGQYADVCVINHTTGSLTVVLEQRELNTKRELVILPQGRECTLRAAVGVWSYDIRSTGTIISMRKGDMLVEGCHDIEMTIKI